MLRVLTIGHSSHSMDHFLALLRQHQVEVLVDIRSTPHSGYVPHFDEEFLRRSLADAGLRYLFLGAELGGRPEGSEFYDSSGYVRYSDLGHSAKFIEGIARLERGASQYLVALMCGEEDPAHCHRRLLVGRVIVERGAELLHIRGDGTLQTDEQVARDSGKMLVSDQPALFAELEQEKWRSTASVSRKRAQLNSLGR